MAYFMKKLLLSIAIIAASFAAKAQASTVVAKQDPLLNPLGIHFWGNNDPAPSCVNDRGTSLYALNPGFTPYNAPALFWLPIPTPGTFVSGFNLDVDMGGGIHYGAPVYLCGLISGTYGLMLGGVYPVTMDVVVTGTTYTFDFH
jgi:hypothetical protein